MGMKNIIAVGRDTVPYFSLVSWDGENLTELDTYTFSDNPWRVRFSPGGQYIAVVHEASPYFTLLEWDGENLTKVDEYILPSVGRNCSWSPDGKYIAVGHEGQPYFTLLKFDGTNLTKADDFTLGTYVTGCSFSSDGTLIAVAYRTSPYFTLLKWDGTNLTKGADYTLSDKGAGCSFNPDGEHIAVIRLIEKLEIYKWTGVELTQEDSLTVEDNCISDWTADGEYIVIGGYQHCYLIHWDKATKTLTEVADYDVLTSNTNGVSISPDGKTIAIAHTQTPYLTLLNWDGESLTKLDDFEGVGWSRACHLIPTDPPVANFSVQALEGAIKLTDLSINSPGSWAWDFGDDEVSTEKHPVHIYTERGFFTIKLIATNNWGSSEKIKSNHILVADKMLTPIRTRIIIL